MSSRYSSLPSSSSSSGPRVSAGAGTEEGGKEDEEELLAVEDVQPDDDDMDGLDEVDDRQSDLSSNVAALHVHVPPADSDSSHYSQHSHHSSLSSRHSESHPFDQDVRHMEHTDMQRLHGQQPTPTNRLQTAVGPAQQAAEASRQRAGSNDGDGLTGAVRTAAAPTWHLSSSSAFLSPPGASGGLRKSVSIGDKLAGRAREMAVVQGKRLDAMVRGIEAEPEYVEVRHAHTHTLSHLRHVCVAHTSAALVCVCVCFCVCVCVCVYVCVCECRTTYWRR